MTGILKEKTFNKNLLRFYNAEMWGQSKLVTKKVTVFAFTDFITQWVFRGQKRDFKGTAQGLGAGGEGDDRG